MSLPCLNKVTKPNQTKSYLNVAITIGLAHGTGDHGRNTLHTDEIVVSFHARYLCISTDGHQKGTFKAQFIGTISA